MSDNPLARCIKPPFKADYMGGYIFNADNFMFGEVRGWGALQYGPDAEKTQDYNLKFMVDALNEKAERDATAQKRSNAVAESGYGLPNEPLPRVYTESEVEELKKEIEWLRFYKRNVYHCLGPADDDINLSIIKDFVKQHGMDKLPKETRIQHQEYLNEHQNG